MRADGESDLSFDSVGRVAQKDSPTPSPSFFNLFDKIITNEEHMMLKTVRSSLYKIALNTALKDGTVTEDEQRLLDVFKEKLGLEEEKTHS